VLGNFTLTFAKTKMKKRGNEVFSSFPLFFLLTLLRNASIYIYRNILF